MRLALTFRCFFAFLAMAVWNSAAAQSFHIPMKAEGWLSRGDVAFAVQKGFPDGVLEVKKGSVELKDVSFSDGSIEFEMFMPDHGILGLRFRQQDRANAEALYFRPQPNCATSPDCMQYMPLDHGAFEWDLFPEDEVKAPIRLLSWNHVHLEVTGRTMQVYINGATQPTLRVSSMEGPALSGALSFGGPAMYANLVITPRPSAPPDRLGPAPNDTFLRAWKISTSSTLPTIPDTKLNMPRGKTPPYSARPTTDQGWKSVTTDSKGLVNFSRNVGSASDGSVVSLAWAKTTLLSSMEQTKQVSIGWVREVWVYVNGKLVFAGRNLEGLPAAKSADERISLGNGSFSLPLHKGRNEIMIALDDNLPGNTQHYGWGMQLKLKDLAGIQQARVQ